MARFTTNGNLVTDSATGLTWVKDPSKIISGFSGVIGSSLGSWSSSMGSIAARAYVQVADEVQAGTSVTSGHVYKFTDFEYGDNLWYKAKQTFSCNAHKPGIDSGWASYWAAVDFFEEAAGVTYITSSYRISVSDWNIYHCKSGYTTHDRKPGTTDGSGYWSALAYFQNGLGPNFVTGDTVISAFDYKCYRCIADYTETGDLYKDLSTDTTHWVLVNASSEWTNGTTYSVDACAAIDGAWFYICTQANTSTFIDPSSDTTHWESVGSVSEWTSDQTWSLNDLASVWGTPYVCIQAHTGSYHFPGDAAYWDSSSKDWVCISAHTAASDKYPGNPTYWIAFDSWWRDTWSAIQELTVYPTVNTQIDKCAGLTYESQSDWRMANILELLSVFNFETLDFYTAFADPTIDVWYATDVRFASSTSDKTGDGSQRLGLAGFGCDQGVWHTYPYIGPNLVVTIANDRNTLGSRTLFYLVRGGTIA